MDETPKIVWPLNVSSFTWSDRIKLAKFFLNQHKHWTMGEHVAEFERRMGKFIGARHSVFVSSGSTANTILAMLLRDSLASDKKKNVVVFPSTTWITSVSPFIREGFTPKFVDINLSDLSMDLYKLEEYLRSSAQKVACVFITSLIGLTPDIKRIREIGYKYNVLIMMDNCENTFGTFDGFNVSSYFTSTTSTYFGHQIQSVEGGFIFTNDSSIYERVLMLRNHGMVRSLKNVSWNKLFYENPNVDPQFDFYLLGNNFRNTNIHAFIGCLDLNRVDHYIAQRKRIYGWFSEGLDRTRYWLPKTTWDREHVPFCLPIIHLRYSHAEKSIAKAKLYCKDNGIEYRPIISGNLLRQTCFKKYGKQDDFPMSEYIHTYGFYVGLHTKLKLADIETLVEAVNSI